MEILLLVSLVLTPLGFGGVEPWAFGPLHAVFFGLAAYIFVTGRGYDSHLLGRTLLPAVLGVAAIGALQAFNENPVNAPSALLFTVWRPATFNAVVTWLFYAALLYCVPRIITTPPRFKRLLWTIFVTGVVIALTGMLQRTGENTLIFGLRRVQGEPFGPFVNRDHAANFLVMSALTGLGVFFSGVGALLSQRSRTGYFDLLALQLLELVMLAVVVCGLFLTGSRGGLHSFAVVAAAAGLISAWRIKTWSCRAAAYAGLIALSAGYGVYVGHNRLLLGLEGNTFVRSVNERLSMYKSGTRLLRDFPVFGTGLGAVEHAFPYYKSSGMAEAGLVRHVHSDWLELFLETGLAGGLIYLAGFLAALYRFFRIWACARSFAFKALCGGALGAVTAASAHNLAEFGFQIPANALVFFVLLGALASGPAVEDPRRGEPAEDATPELKPAPRRYAVPAAAAAVLLSVWSVPQIYAWRCDQLAKDASFVQKIRLREISLKWAPSPQAAFRLGGDYYNQGVTDQTASCPLFRSSLRAIVPYLRRAPVNYDLNRLEENLSLQLANCGDNGK